MPQERSGIASALLNNSRELAGLLGVTVIGAVLSWREGAALRHGTASVPAYLDGYHAGLAVTIALVAIGAVVGYLALRRSPAALPGKPAALRGRPAAPAAVPAASSQALAVAARRRPASGTGLG
jgi:hypothetical protein